MSRRGSSKVEHDWSGSVEVSGKAQANPIPFVFARVNAFLFRNAVIRISMDKQNDYRSVEPCSYSWDGSK